MCVGGGGGGGGVGIRMDRGGIVSLLLTVELLVVLFSFKQLCLCCAPVQCH